MLQALRQHGHIARRMCAMHLQGLQLKPPARDVMATPGGRAALRQEAVMLHHGAVSGMLGEHPCASEACRLAKRWAAAQMLSRHLPAEAVELMVASVFTGCVRAPILARK